MIERLLEYFYLFNLINKVLYRDAHLPEMLFKSFLIVKSHRKASN